MPQWRLAQPFRFLAHNGEINTIRGNRNWAIARAGNFRSEKLEDISDLDPVVSLSGSDSSSLDNMLEVLRAGDLAPGVEFLGIDCIAGLKEINSAQRWDIDENPLSEDAALDVVNRKLLRSCFGNLVFRTDMILLVGMDLLCQIETGRFLDHFGNQQKT